MKNWAPFAYPDTNGKHRNANPSQNIRGSWPDGLGYQQILDELNAIRAAGGLSESDTVSTQILQAIRSGLLGYYLDAGSANAPTITPSPAPAALVDGNVFTVRMAAAPTGASVLHVNSLSAPIVRRGNAALTGSEWAAGDVVTFRYSSGVNAFQVAGLTLRDIAPAPTRVVYLAIPGTTTLTVAANETRARAIGVGGGGGGGASIGNPSGGAGGGGGGSFDEWVTGLTSGQTIAATVGGGGVAGLQSTGLTGGTGGTTSFGSYASATGGTGGNCPPPTGIGGTPGNGGSSSFSGGATGRTYQGAQGGASYTFGTYPISGYGGAAGLGGGGTSPWGIYNVSVPGPDGTYPGGGAGGSINQANGGTGGTGSLIVEFYS